MSIRTTVLLARFPALAATLAVAFTLTSCGGGSKTPPPGTATATLTSSDTTILAFETASKPGLATSKKQGTATITATVTEVTAGNCCEGEIVSIDGRASEFDGTSRYRFTDTTAGMPIVWTGNQMSQGVDVRITGVMQSSTFTVSNWTSL